MEKFVLNRKNYRKKYLTSEKIINLKSFKRIAGLKVFETAGENRSDFLFESGGRDDFDVGQPA